MPRPFPRTRCPPRPSRPTPEPTTLHPSPNPGEHFMSAAHDVTDDTFASEVLASSTPIMVDFWAEWCGPCKAVSPILDAIAEEHADKIKIVKLNVDDNPQTAIKYQITSIPAMYVFQN